MTGSAPAITRQAAVAIENARLHERARRAAVLEERRRLARELHDSVTDSLVRICQKTETADRALECGDREPVNVALEEIATTTQQALSNMRLLLFEPASAARDHGLERMRDVAARLGGTLSVESSIGTGSHVRATVPR